MASNRLHARAGRAAAPLIAVAAMLLSACADLHLAGADREKSGNSVITVFSPPSPTNAVQMAADPYDADARQRGILLLANAPWGGEEAYLKYYRRAIDDEDPIVRVSAARALGLHGMPEDARLLIDQARDDEERVRWEVARSLQRIHSDAAIPVLLRGLREEREDSPRVREACAAALGQYAKPRVVDALIDALADRDLAVNIAARESLHSLTGQSFGLDISRWVAWERSRDPEQLFAEQQEYTYPVFHRNAFLLERINPFDSPPNETPAQPIGMTSPLNGSADAADRGEPDGTNTPEGS